MWLIFLVFLGGKSKPMVWKFYFLFLFKDVFFIGIDFVNWNKSKPIFLQFSEFLFYFWSNLFSFCSKSKPIFQDFLKSYKGCFWLKSNKSVNFLRFFFNFYKVFGWNGSLIFFWKSKPIVEAFFKENFQRNVRVKFFLFNSKIKANFRTFFISIKTNFLGWSERRRHFGVFFQ